MYKISVIIYDIKENVEDVIYFEKFPNFEVAERKYLKKAYKYIFNRDSTVEYEIVLTETNDNVESVVYRTIIK